MCHGVADLVRGQRFDRHLAAGIFINSSPHGAWDADGYRLDEPQPAVENRSHPQMIHAHESARMN